MLPLIESPQELPYPSWLRIVPCLKLACDAEVSATGG
jgi:hypothetical protein